MRDGRSTEALLWMLAAALFVAGHNFSSTAEEDLGLQPRARDVVRIATWNVGGSAQGRSHPLLRENVSVVVATLKMIEADLVILQELGDPSRLDELMSGLGEPWKTVHRRSAVAILSPCADVERWRPPRAALDSVGAKLRIHGRTLTAAGMHASAFSARDRNREIGLVIDALLEAKSDAYVLSGDLNLDLDLDKRGDLFTDDLHTDVETYNYVARSLTDVGRGRGTTAEPDRRLDYVFASASFEVVTAGPVRGQRVGTMDHDPVVADLRFR